MKIDNRTARMRHALQGWLLALFFLPLHVMAVPVDSLDGTNSVSAEAPVVEDVLVTGFDPADLQLLNGLDSLWSYLVSVPQSVESHTRKFPMVLAQAGESDIEGFFPESQRLVIPRATGSESGRLETVIPPPELTPESVTREANPGPRSTLPVRANKRHLWGQLFSGELFYSIDFSYLSTDALGESLWSTLEVGQGANNDWVVTDLDFTLSAADYGLDFTGWHGGEQAFVYLDATRQGMGVCQLVLNDDPSLVDRPNPGSAESVCVDSDTGVLGVGDSIRIRPNVDIWIREIKFQSPIPGDDDGQAKAVGIGGGSHVFANQLEPGENHSWRPAVPYFVAANSRFEISHVDAPVLLSELSFYRAVPPAPANTSFRVYNELPEPPGNGQASVDEPLGLMLLGLLFLLMERRKRRGISYRSIRPVKFS